MAGTEKTSRAGTENVPGIVGYGLATNANKSMKERTAKIEIRDPYDQQDPHRDPVRTRLNGIK